MKLTEFIKTMLGWKAQVDEKLEKLTKPAEAAAPAPETKPAAPAAEGKHDDDEEDEECEACGGSGKCAECEGSGEVKKAKKGAKKSEHADLRDQVIDLTAKLTKAEADIKQRDERIKTLESELAAEKSNTTKTLASLGIKVADLPAKKPEQGKAGENAFERYQALVGSDPIAAGRYYAEHADEIIAAMHG